jgi:hypothetical protein
VFDKELRVTEENPTWITSYNFPCLLDLTDMLQKFGPFQNLQGREGEKRVKYCQTLLEWIQRNWQQNLTDKKLQILAIKRISRSKKVKCIYDGHDQQLDCFDDNSDLDNVIIEDNSAEEAEMQSTKSKVHYCHAYQYFHRVTSDFKNRRLLSVIRLQEGEYGCILCGKKCIPFLWNISVDHKQQKCLCLL